MEPIQEIPMAEIYSDPGFNCRDSITPFDTIELARSIKIHGLLQAIVVQPYEAPPHKYRILMGHRRHQAFRINKADTIPGIIKTGLSEVEAHAMNLIENLERKSLNIMEEAKAINKFYLKGLTQQAIAKLIGKPASWVAIRRIAMNLPEMIQAEIAAGLINQEQIKAIDRIPSVNAKFEAVRQIKEAKFRGDRRQVEILIKPTKKVDNDVKVKRSQSEMFEMQDLIRDTLGNSLATRVLAWATGVISSKELYEDIKAQTDALGIPWHIPITVTE